jgi:hypothetical protein
MVSSAEIEGQKIAAEEQVTEERGEHLARDLDRLFGVWGYDVDLVRNHGLASLDVLHGAEIVAADSLMARRVYAAEPESDEPSLNRFIDAVLKRIGEKRQGDIQLIRRGPEEALQIVEKQLGGEKLGLVTWLNFYSLGVDEAKVVRVFKLASNLLVSGGLVVASSFDSVAVPFDRRIFDQVCRQGIENLELRVFSEARQTPAGKDYLLGWRA